MILHGITSPSMAPATTSANMAANSATAASASNNGRFQFMGGGARG